VTPGSWPAELTGVEGEAAAMREGPAEAKAGKRVLSSGEF